MLEDFGRALLEERGKKSEEPAESDEEAVSVSSDEEAPPEAADEEEAPERVPTDDEALPELPPEYQPGGEHDIRLRLYKKADQPEEERDMLRKWWKYRHFTGLTREEHNSRFVRGDSRTYSGGGFANFNLNDMIFRKQMIDAGFTRERALATIKEFKRLRQPLPAWPVGAPVPAALEIALEQQKKASKKHPALRNPKPPPEYKEPRVERPKAPPRPPKEDLSPEEAERRRRNAELKRESRARLKAKASPKSKARSSRG
jgi:hypothetical protein